MKVCSLRSWRDSVRERVLFLAASCFGLGCQAARGLVRSRVEFTLGISLAAPPLADAGFARARKIHSCPLIPPAAQARKSVNMSVYFAITLIIIRISQKRYVTLRIWTFFIY